ncbi:hypothetical protein KQI49_13930 [Virgibacillus sp. MSJ-26]|uniref:type IV toxin-antitoxin system AbiEi family antitoxin domain-containing protein n=1 Tax=Virgibacillus sp. MSJ-26 TaxID=2841522 RepID=UPI001C10A928|nr:type IV toxin-antitoxin system AbiEi family antitoxin domain-containing protein [Virgibacillus sp. MSJ-26]MBU5467925.1 hypothetical protein [Virgibacillus sp. MSJ-26]
MIEDTLKHAFEENNGILTPEIATDYGIHDSTLRKAVERKDIQKYCRGIYLLDDFYFDDLYIIQLQYPGAVYSHETAVMLHTLSSYSPFFYHVSFGRGYHLSNAKEQHIKPHYISKNELDDEYIEKIDSWDSNPIKVTNLEKTIVDMLRHKNPMPGIVDEMIHDYVTREDKNIDKLVDYACRFDVLTSVKERVFPFAESTNDEEFNNQKI